MFVWTASRCCVGCLCKLVIITVIKVVLFWLVWYFFDVYLYTDYCIVIHVVWISLILKNGIKVVMWYSFIGHFGLQVGNVCLFLFDFVCLVGNFVFILKVIHILFRLIHIVLITFFSIKIFTPKIEPAQKSMDLSPKSHLVKCFVAAQNPHHKINRLSIKSLYTAPILDFYNQIFFALFINV